MAHRIRIVLCSVLFVTCFMAAPVTAAEVVDKIVAVINGEIVTLGEINQQLEEWKEKLPVQESAMAQEAMLQQVRESILQRRINEILLKQEVERMDLKIETAEIESRIREFREQQNMDEEAFRAQLALQGKTRAQFMEELEQEMLKQRVIGFNVHRKVVVTDAEVDSYIASGGAVSQPLSPAPSASPVPAGGKVRIQLIMVNDANLAKKLHGSISSGDTSFAAAAKEHSIGPGASDGGALGEVSLADLAAPMRKAVEGLTPGDVSAPFQLGDSMAMVRLESHSAGGSAPATPAPASPSLPSGRYDKEAVRAQLVKEKTEQVFKEYLEKLKRKSLIRITW